MVHERSKDSGSSRKGKAWGDWSHWENQKTSQKGVSQRERMQIKKKMERNKGKDPT